MIRLGIVGSGGIAASHISAALALGASVTLLRRGGSDGLKAQFAVSIVDTLLELFACSDIVLVAAPTPTHAALCQAAFDAGKHVICEKPLAMSASEAQGMADAATVAGVRFFPAHVVRYFAGYASAHEQATGTGTQALLMRQVATPERGWFLDPDAGGGVIRDLMVHDLDQARWLLGEVETVAATHPGGDPHAAGMHLTHTSGAKSRLIGIWGPAGAPFSSTLELSTPDGPLRASHEDPGPDPYTAQLADFFDAIATGREARVTPADGVAAVALVDAAYASLASGNWAAVRSS